jgi:hypothetical protein
MKARASGNSKRPTIWHIFEFERRFELSEDARSCRKTPLVYCREAVSTTDDDAKDYVLQLTALRRCDNHLELHGAFIALRNQAAGRSRAYRGYLLNGRREPAKLADISDWLGVPASQARKLLSKLESVGLIEKVPLPQWDLDKNEAPSQKPKGTDGDAAEGDSAADDGGAEGPPEISGNLQSPFKNGNRRERKGNGKEVEDGNGLKRKEKRNGKKEKAKAQTKAKPPSTPTAAPPPALPTEADARGPVGPARLNAPWGSDRHSEPTRLAQLMPSGVFARDSGPKASSHRRYTDRAYLFAAEIYTALDLYCGDREFAREMACFAARWTEAELAALPPPVETALWDQAVRHAAKVRRKKRAKKPGAVWCDIWTALLAKAKTGELASSSVKPNTGANGPSESPLRFRQRMGSEGPLSAFLKRP